MEMTVHSYPTVPTAFVSFSDYPRGVYKCYPIIDTDLEYNLEMSSEMERPSPFDGDDIEAILKLRGFLLATGLMVSGVVGSYSDLSVTVGNKSWDVQTFLEGEKLARAFDTVMNGTLDKIVQVAGEVFSGGLHLDPLLPESHQFLVDGWNKFVKSEPES